MAQSKPTSNWRLTARQSIRNIVDRVVCFAGLFAIVPLLGVIALLIYREDRGPVFYRQVRIGRNRQPFLLLKFRSMRANSVGAEITAAGDRRITRIGRILRHYKLDELPQLWNVVKGDMGLVGPRPEVASYVDPSSAAWERVLSVRPGITDLATLVYRNEEDLLREVKNPEQYYRQVVLPEKLRLNMQYLDAAGFWRDWKLILLTLRYSVFPHGFEAETVKKVLMA